MQPLRFRTLAFCLLSALTLVSGPGCRRHDNPPNPLFFPLVPGRFWRYVTNERIVAQNGTSEFNYQPLVQAGPLTTLPNGQQAYTLTELSDPQFTTRSSTIYCNNDPSGFYEVAYRLNDPFIFYKDDTQGVQEQKHTLGQYTFTSLAELRSALKGGRISAHAKTTDTLIYNDQPVYYLRYPLRINELWQMRSAQSVVPMQKVLLRREDVPVPAGLFNCVVYQVFYDFDRNGLWDQNITAFQYYSEQGLIYETYTVSGVQNATTGYLQDYYLTSSLTAF